MKTAVKIIAVAAGLALVVLLAMFIRKSTEELDVSTENDIRIEVKNDLPDGLNVFTDGDGILPPLWKVEKDGAVIYMMGSVHAADKSLYPLDGRVKKAYEECEKVAVEHRNLTLSDFVSSGSGKTYPETYEEGDELKNHLSEKRYKLLTDAASKAGYDLNKLDKMQLWAVYTEFSAIVGSEQNTSTGKSDGGTQYGIDTVFQKLAVNDKKERLNIETDEEKEAFYPEMPEDFIKSDGLFGFTASLDRVLYYLGKRLAVLVKMLRDDYSRLVMYKILLFFLFLDSLQSFSPFMIPLVLL